MPDDLEPEKPVSEMTADELAEFRRKLRRELRDLERPRRDKKLRQGRAKPRNRAEWEIFGSHWSKGEQRSDQPDA